MLTTRVAAVVTPLTRPVIERALALARWPATDADRAAFHNRYIARFPGSTGAAVAVASLEVITEFRRMELIAEAHARLNDLFARGGAIREAEDALRPFRGRISIVAHLQLGAGVMPAADVAVLFERAPAPQPVQQIATPVYSDGSLVGIDAEALFAAAAIPQATRTVVVLVDRRPIARAAFDFGTLE